MKPPRFKTPPTVEINPADRYGWMRFLAALIWAGDQRKLDQALVTYASELMGVLQDEVQQPDRLMSVDELGVRLGIPPRQLVRIPGCTAFFSAFFGQPEESFRTLTRQVFNPAGHFRTVAEAPGSQQVLQDFNKAAQGGAFWAGGMLFLLVKLHRHHPDHPASLNRVIAILEGRRARGLLQLPSDRTLKSAWASWRHLAPLWAALIGELENAWASSPDMFTAVFETMMDPVRLGRLLGRAKWYRSFATTFIPEHTSAPLIPTGDAVEFLTNAPEEEPPVGPLTPDDLEVARRYRAPTSKYNE